MGFPFDRKATKNDGSLEDFLLPNMNMIDCKIIFKDTTVERASQRNTNSDEKNKDNDLDWDLISIFSSFLLSILMPQ